MRYAYIAYKPALIVLLTFVFASSLAAWDYPEPAKKSQTSPEQAAIPELDDILSYCDRLSEMDQPAKGCDCLYDAYAFSSKGKDPQIAQFYQDWKKMMKQAEEKILKSENNSALILTQNFCYRYYGNPDTIEFDANSGTRDKAIMNPKLSNKEENTAFINEKRELYQMTKGASDVYCQASIEVSVYERILNTHPLAGMSPAQAYSKLSRTDFCHTRFR